MCHLLDCFGDGLARFELQGNRSGLGFMRQICADDLHTHRETKPLRGIWRLVWCDQFAGRDAEAVIRHHALAVPLVVHARYGSAVARMQDRQGREAVCCEDAGARCCVPRRGTDRRHAFREALQRCDARAHDPRGLSGRHQVGKYRDDGTRHAVLARGRGERIGRNETSVPFAGFFFRIIEDHRRRARRVGKHRIAARAHGIGTAPWGCREVERIRDRRIGREDRLQTRTPLLAHGRKFDVVRVGQIRYEAGVATGCRERSKAAAFRHTAYGKQLERFSHADRVLRADDAEPLE